jgi:hypothetical protein
MGALKGLVKKILIYKVPIDDSPKKIPAESLTIHREMAQQGDFQKPRTDN